MRGVSGTPPRASAPLNVRRLERTVAVPPLLERQRGITLEPRPKRRTVSGGAVLAGTGNGEIRVRIRVLGVSIGDLEIEFLERHLSPQCCDVMR